MHTAIQSCRRGLARSLAKRIGETLGEKDWRGEEGEEGSVLIKSSNPQLAGGKRMSQRGKFIDKKVIKCEYEEQTCVFLQDMLLIVRIVANEPRTWGLDCKSH